MFEGDAPLRWQIEASHTDLDDARRFAGLNRNVLVAQGEVLGQPMPLRYRLGYPGYFCPEPSMWLKCLSFLVLHNRSLKIFLERLDREDGERVEAFVQLYPQMDEELREMLSYFSGDAVERLVDLGARIDLAFDRLRAEGA